MQIIEIKPNNLSHVMGPINKGKTCYLLLYANWCGHCTTFKPVWNSVHSEMKNELNMLNAIIAQIEQSEIDKISNKPKFMKDVIGYPTVREITISGFNNIEQRDKEELKKIIRKKKGGRKTRVRFRGRFRKTKKRYRKTPWLV
jgi:thiol-disulfide isomerase/thioredoxin